MKKLLSILAAVGLTATASTSAVACSSVFASGSLTINGVDDLKMDYSNDKAAGSSLLDQYITSKQDWRANNNALAKQISDAADKYNRDNTQANLDALNTAAWDVVVPIFEANVKSENYYSLDARDLYNKLNPDNTDAHDTATLTNKLNLKVQFIKLGEAFKVLSPVDKNGNKTLNVYQALNVNYDDTNNINSYVHIKDMKTLQEIFHFNFNGGDQLQKIINRPDHSVSGFKLQITTAPMAVIDKSNYIFKASDKKITLTGANLNLLNNDNTKLYVKGSNKAIDGLTYAAVREEYRSVDITVENELTTGDYVLVYTPEQGKTITVDITID